jgi:hypothetical protein
MSVQTRFQAGTDRGSRTVPALHRLHHLRRQDPEAKFPPVDALLPPEGAPNVLVIVLDDVGFGASSAFGGPRLSSWRGYEWPQLGAKTEAAAGGTPVLIPV